MEHNLSKLTHLCQAPLLAHWNHRESLEILGNADDKIDP